MDGALFVAIPRPRGSVLALLDRGGRPRPGWPISVKDSTSCGLLLPVEDGSVRVVCTLENPEGNRFSGERAFAFDAIGRSMAGWPIDLSDNGANGYFAGRVIADELTVLVWASFGDVIEEGQPAGTSWVMTLAADGAVRSGAKVPFGTDCCTDAWAIGPDRVAYGVVRQFGEAPSSPKSSKLLAVSFAGSQPGFPVAIDGIASPPAFDATGRIHLIVNTGPERLAQPLVVDANGEAAVDGPVGLGFTASADCAGIEGTCEVPAAPLVGPDGSTYVIGAEYLTIVAGLSPSGQIKAGWPYRSAAGRGAIGFCPAGAVCEGSALAAPAIGPDNVLYLLHAAPTTSRGGSIVAIGPDGRVRPGWPIELRRAGSAFWSVVVGSDGTAFALAIEPEAAKTFSATVLAVAPDSTVLYRTTVIDP